MTHHQHFDAMGFSDCAIWGRSITQPGMWFVNEYGDTYYAVVDNFGTLVEVAT